jgi:hypothetical protein
MNAEQIVADLSTLLADARKRRDGHEGESEIYLRSSRSYDPIPGAYGASVQHSRLAVQAAEDVAAIERVIALVQKPGMRGDR